MGHDSLQEHGHRMEVQLLLDPFMQARVGLQRLFDPIKRRALHRRRVDFWTKSRAFTIEKARRLLGYRPERTLADSVRRSYLRYVEEGLL